VLICGLFFVERKIMNDEILWKKIISFMLTFTFGFFVTDFISFYKVPEKVPDWKTSNTTFSHNQKKYKNCVPEYKKYDKYPEEPVSIEQLIEETEKVNRWLLTNKNAAQEEKEFYQKKLKKNWKKMFPNKYDGKRKFYEDEKELSKVLLYSEKCYGL
jgi:hypothetical protein